MDNLSEIKNDLIATAKGLCHNEDLTINFDNNYVNDIFKFSPTQISSNKISCHESNNINALRAIIDLAISYKLFHNSNLKKYQRSIQEFIDDFEKIRLVININDYYRGCGINIINKITKEVDDITDTVDAKSLSLILLQQNLPQKISQSIKLKAEEITQYLQENNREILNLISKLSNFLDDQKKYQEVSIEIYEKLQKLNDDQQDLNDEQDQNQTESHNDDFNSPSNNDNSDFSPTKDDNSQQQDNKKDSSKNLEQNQDFNTKLDSKSVKSSFSFGSSNEIKQSKIDFYEGYKIYSKKYDEIIIPNKLVTKEELQNLRLELDFKINSLHKISKKLTYKLQRKLLTKKHQTQIPNSNEGILNRKKLSSIIIKQDPRNIWLNNNHDDFNDSAITFLLDNSGSMRGRPIIMAALCCEILVQILEKFQIKTEIIGFTTKDWKGGRSRRDWEISGKARNPGRLNDLRHIIYKSFNKNFKQSKNNLGLMLKEGILKENIDGEAIIFAKNRLQKQEAKRKILMVISDGNPIDDSTNNVNDEDILNDHLKKVVSSIQKRKQIEIMAIGIGHDVRNFYKNAISIKNLEDLGDNMIKKICDIL